MNKLLLLSFAILSLLLIWCLNKFKKHKNHQNHLTLSSTNFQGYKKVFTYAKPLFGAAPASIPDIKLPENFSWQYVKNHSLYPMLPDGNYVSPVENQHIPVYCGSCFCFGSLHALADRFYIMNMLNYVTDKYNKDSLITSDKKDRLSEYEQYLLKTEIKPPAQVQLSVQHLLNSLPNMTCLTGGDSGLVYDFIMKSNGIVDSTCKSYVADAIPEQGKPECFTCLVPPQLAKMTCDDLGPGYSQTTWNKECCKVPSNSYKVYNLQGFNNLSEKYKNSNNFNYKALEREIKTELYMNGPLTACLDATPIENYRGGLFNDKSFKEINHLVYVVGWETDSNGSNYWIIKNSWGSFWGEDGFIRVNSDCVGLNSIDNDYVAPYPKGWNCVMSKVKGAKNMCEDSKVKTRM